MGMETVIIDILHPKAKRLLKDLADMDLIRIKDEGTQTELQAILARLRTKANPEIAINEITAEVESARKERYGE